MPLESHWFTKNLHKIQRQELNLLTATVKVALYSNVGATYRPDRAVVEFMAGLANEVTNVGATTGYARKASGTVTTTIDGTGRIVFDCPNILWTGINTNEDIAYAVFYVEITNDADSLVVSYLEGLELQTNGSNITLDMPAGGFGVVDPNPPV